MAIHEPVHPPIRHVERRATDPPRPQRRERRRALGIDDGLMGVALLAGPANVIMQLARPGVGYGVMESRVESGRVDRHPIKRARTTFTYLAVATNGSDAQKEAFRRAVNRAHAQVYSTPESPVSYNAFDPDAAAVGGGLPVQGRASTSIACSSVRWTTRTPTATTARAWRWPRRCRCRRRCGRRTGRRSTGTGRSRWTRCTSTTPCASTYIRSPPTASGA